MHSSALAAHQAKCRQNEIEAIEKEIKLRTCRFTKSCGHEKTNKIKTKNIYIHI